MSTLRQQQAAVALHEMAEGLVSRYAGDPRELAGQLATLPMSFAERALVVAVVAGRLEHGQWDKLLAHLETYL